MALVVLNDADNHRSGVAANHRLPSALEMEEVSSGLEDLVRYSMEASPQVGPKALAGNLDVQVIVHYDEKRYVHPSDYRGPKR